MVRGLPHARRASRLVPNAFVSSGPTRFRSTRVATPPSSVHNPWQCPHYTHHRSHTLAAPPCPQHRPQMFALIFPLLNIVLSLVTISFYSRYDLRKGLVVGSVFLLLSSWVRYLGSVLALDMACAVIFTGQALGAIAMPFLLAGAPALSDAWFSEDSRAIATAVGGLASVIGTVVASMLAPGFFPAVSSPIVINSTTLPPLQAGLESFMLFEAILGTVPAVTIILFFKSRPPTPPSASAEKALLALALGAEKGEQNNGTLLDTGDSTLVVLRRTLAAAFSNTQFLLLMAAFGSGYGALNAITTVINQILQPLGYSDDDIGNIGAALGLGVLGSFVFGALTDYTKRFKPVVRACAVVAGAGYALFAALLYTPLGGGVVGHAHHPWLLFAALGVVGFFGVPLVPLILELGVETLFPAGAGEAVVSVFLWAAANVFGLAATLISTTMQQCGSPPVGGGGSASGDCSNPYVALRARTARRP